MYEIEKKCRKCKNYGTAICYRCDMYFDEFDPIDEPKQINADLIRGMDIEELANFILHHDVCPGFVTDTFSDANRKKYGFDGRSERCEWKDECHECWLDWLRQEVEE